MRTTTKKTHKHATQPLHVLEAPPPAARGPKRAPITLPSPRIEQPLDPPEFSGSVLSDIRARWVTGGSLLPTPSESEQLLIAYKSAHDRVNASRKVLQDALTIETGTILDLARSFGANSLRIGGVVHDFACRGETVFFRKKTVGVIDTDITSSQD